jgi:hypothetical protein
MPFELTVALKVFAKKRKAAALGKETEALLADWIDIGALVPFSQSASGRKIDKEAQ